MVETVELKNDYTGERKYLDPTTINYKISKYDLSPEKGIDYTRLWDLLKATLRLLRVF